MPERSRVSISKCVALFLFLLELHVKGNDTQPFHVPDLKMAHEQQTKSLEEEFEKIRLSLQVKCCF